MEEHVNKSCVHSPEGHNPDEFGWVHDRLQEAQTRDIGNE